ncbi:nucleotide-binding oligomerization domain-containing protein 1-like [Acropora muricata]|uniref:nucleotide-binding oligomerization domain-containing protein 1-like n=1 Tax=Acropora muricata TaxID=159855 RepID=UPI0034E42DA7
MDCTAIKEAISPKTLNKFTFALVIVWIVVGATLCIAFAELEISESRYDIRCVTGSNPNSDFIHGKCYDQYRMRNHKLGIPPYLFVIVNVLLLPVVTVIYSQYAKSTVDELERNPQDAQGLPRNRRRTLFMAYICQLIINIVLEITFIVLLETDLFYPMIFPSDFSCHVSVQNPPFNRTQFNCSNQRAGYKNVWTKVVTTANGIFASFAFLEIISILSRGRHGKEFMENWRFYADHLKSNSDEQRPSEPAGIPLVEPPSQHQAVNISLNSDEITMSPEVQEHAQAQNDFNSAIQTLKKNCLQGTDKLSDLKQPFGQPNHGEGQIHDLTIDQIYVHVVIVEGRAYHNFPKGRWQQLKEYPPHADDCLFKKPVDILDENHKNVLVVGRPGIGKTSLSTKLFRLWASGEAFNGDENFNVVFLVKFRRFNNDNADLSLRDLLVRAETVHSLDDAVWDFIKKEPKKVLLIFDGLDDYSRKADIKAQEDDPTYKDCVEEKMPLFVLYNKLAEGKLLPGASILTTTRPTAVKCVLHVRFHRTVEIRGFTSDAVKEYVENFTRGNPETMEKMWEHIKSNINLFSFCYIPMNCFLICHCLRKIILSESSQALPAKMTDIYKMTVKMFLFNHNREGFSLKELERLKSTHMYEPFEKFPEELQKIFNSLGEIAFKGTEKGGLLFESSEVSGLEDCGLLHKLPDLKPKALDDPPKSQFCFIHLTVQEFFAAKHLVNTETDEGIERFVSMHINDGKWQVVLQFVAGLLKGSSEIFVQLLPTLKSRLLPSKPELTFWPATKEDKGPAVQVCKCLYEITDEQQPELQNKIEEIKFNAVEFSECLLAPIDLVAVLHFLENAEEVLHIDLPSNELGYLGANEVKKFIVNRERQLKWLNLRYNNLTDRAAEDLAAILKHSNCKLESLCLSDNNFTDYAAKDFAAALKHSNCKLESLYLSFNNFTDNAAKDLAAALKHSNCKVKSLDLSFNNLIDNAAMDFAAALKHSNCKLQLLDLSFNSFTDNAAMDFAAALKHSNCKLQSLDLSVNNFTDNAAKDFATAHKHSNCKLKTLYLSHNNFTDNAANDFAAALKHRSCKLESLYLLRHNFTKEGQQYLTDAGKQSNCKVYFG